MTCTKVSGFIVLAAGLLVAQPVNAQAALLPISEGVWVKTDTRCGAATNVFVYNGNRFGSVYFYGPEQSMGPADETETLSKTGHGADGFTVVNEGPIEVAPRPNGHAEVRAYSLSDGVQWAETVRLCTPATLSPRLRTALARLDLT